MCRTCGCCSFLFFFFNDTATTEIYTLSLHDALPIYGVGQLHGHAWRLVQVLELQADASRPFQAEQALRVLVMHHHRSEEHTSELQSPDHLVCRLLLEKKKKPIHKCTKLHSRQVQVQV